MTAVARREGWSDDVPPSPSTNSRGTSLHRLYVPLHPLVIVINLVPTKRKMGSPDLEYIEQTDKSWRRRCRYWSPTSTPSQRIVKL